MRDQISINRKISASLIGNIPATKGKHLVARVECSIDCVCGKRMIMHLTESQIRTNKFKKTCSSECFKLLASAYGRKSAERQSRRSKNEVMFAQLCKHHFVNVVCNARMFNGWDADIILPYEKLAILWNGKWHYEQITKNHSLLQVQNRDQLKLVAISECGYTPYVIKDMGRVDANFVNMQFSELVKWLSRGPHKAE